MRRWWPEELALVGGKDFWLQLLRLLLLAGRRRRRRRGGLQDDVRDGRMNGVAVLLPFPEFAADKTDGYHGAVAAHHFIFGAPFRETEDSYLEAVGVLNSAEFRTAR